MDPFWVFDPHPMDQIVFMVLPGHHQLPVKEAHLLLQPIPMMGLPQDILWSKMAGDTMEVRILLLQFHKISNILYAMLLELENSSYQLQEREISKLV